MAPPQRGEIFEVNFERSEGARIKKTRPAVTIQNDIGNRYAPHTIVAAIRTAERKGFLPVFVRVPKGTAGLTKATRRGRPERSGFNKPTPGCGG